ncbi:MAG: AraC family transcriptional regulator, arabinose operon regulatory protein [Acidobacteriota bacterium]|jgi:AraC family transcriptional regulator of arabinose operon|nr:AraC family transcriptional regulator, arabinose operon regulatory protein [Acidobacteriota bacterium]MDT7808085.1 AraC family transcriptional regulator, arabinose operon regulatory protein [Acidobacteriota bacterium]
MDKRIELVVNHIQANIGRRLKFSEIARSLNLSVSRLSHLFKSEVGMTPAQYLKKLRLERAKELGETTFLRVKEIMSAVGMTDESHFIRDFKTRYGETPAAYHQRYRRASIRAGETKRSSTSG